MVLEYSQYGNVSTVIENMSICSRTKVKFCLDIANGMKYLHDNNIIHRGLRPSSILVMNLCNDSESCIKLGDLRSSQNVLEKEVTETPLPNLYAYYAPESLENGIFTMKSDVYSFSMIMWHIFAEETPFDAFDPSHITLLLMKDSRLNPENMEEVPKVKKLMKKCWSRNPNQRHFFHPLILNNCLFQT